MNWVIAHSLRLAFLLALIAHAPLAYSETTASLTFENDENCIATNPVQINFANGAGWSLCFANRVRENLVISNVRYKSTTDEPFQVLASAGISQLHVAYDDRNVTYNDVTQFGLGDSFMVDLTAKDCPEGNLVTSANRSVTCVTHQASQSVYRTQNYRQQPESLNLFSVSQVGSYTYVLDWTFYDDGTIEPAVGASGALQRSSPIVEQPFGRVLSEDPDTLWLSHTHNYYWRLDFDLGSLASDDAVVEIRQALDPDGFRATTTTPYTVEQAKRIDPAAFQLWRVFESQPSAQNTLPQGYQLAPQRHGHRLVRAQIEPYTDYDFFVTVANDCERFASDNALFNPECTNHVLEFANNESLLNQDIVLWHRVAFHHVPRNEDQRIMHTHWDAFELTPINFASAISDEFDSINPSSNSDGHSAGSDGEQSSKETSGGFFGAVSLSPIAALWAWLLALRFFRRTAPAKPA